MIVVRGSLDLVAPKAEGLWDVSPLLCAQHCGVTYQHMVHMLNFDAVWDLGCHEETPHVFKA